MYMRPITQADVAEAAAIANAAFSSDALFKYLFPRQDKYPDDLRRSHLLRMRHRMVRPDNFGYVMVTEESDADWDGKSRVTGFVFFARTGDDEKAKILTRDTWAKSNCALCMLCECAC